MKIPKHFPLVAVHWKDAWHSMEEIPHEDLGEPYDLWEVGFLVKNTDSAVVLTMEMDQEGTLSSRNTLTIPKVNIVEVCFLGPKRLRKEK
jgi:hypothetical protein